MREQVHVNGACSQKEFSGKEAIDGFNPGILGMVPGGIGSVMAAEALKLLLGIGISLSGQLLVFDALEASFNKVLIAKRPACPGCGKKQVKEMD